MIISVDTYRPAVVEAVLAAGASIVNDISGLLYPEVAGLVAAGCRAGDHAPGAAQAQGARRRPLRRGAGGVTADVVAFLRERARRAAAAGVPEEAVIVDPGPDFAKTPAQTVEVLRHLDQVQALGRPLLLALRARTSSVPSPPPLRPAGGTLAAIGHVLGRRRDHPAGSRRRPGGRLRGGGRSSRAAPTWPGANPPPRPALRRQDPDAV